jgi:hypothetical protein
MAIFTFSQIAKIMLTSGFTVSDVFELGVAIKVSVIIIA